VAARQKLVDITDQISNLQAQVKQLQAQKFAISSQPQQDEAEMRTQISALQRDLAGMRQDLSIAQTVVTPYAGEVLELKVYPGSTVAAGEPVLSVQPDQQNLEVLAYLPSSQAKEVKEGMEAQVSPSNVKREEYGFIRGTVSYISDYPVTTAALMRNFENESLVTALSKAGPVTEVRVNLDRDPTTTRFIWSNSKGPAVSITSGTICAVQIVTRKQQPITLVFPYIKKKLGLS
jgi:HlyD family secretion protein